MDTSIKGKAVLVTGASQGLGRVIAKTFAHEGCRVFINYANHPDNAEKVLCEILAEGGQAETARFDVSDENTVNAFFAAKKAEFGGIDILVNNARLDPWLRKPGMSEGEWFDAVVKVNLRGAFVCAQAFFDNVKDKGWGRLVNISSVRAFIPAEPDMIAYGITKAGMHVITRSYAQNGGKFGVTANTVAPGMVVTENIHKRLTPEKLADESSKNVIGRGASSEEIADAVLFAVKNGYVTGETININGGMYYEP